MFQSHRYTLTLCSTCKLDMTRNCSCGAMTTTVVKTILFLSCVSLKSKLFVQYYQSPMPNLCFTKTSKLLTFITVESKLTTYPLKCNPTDSVKRFFSQQSTHLIKGVITSEVKISGLQQLLSSS